MPKRAWRIELDGFTVLINAYAVEEALDVIYQSARSIPRETYKVKEITE